MTALDFLSVRPAERTDFRPRLRSPLDRALRGAPANLRDRSLELAKFEVRGELMVNGFERRLGDELAHLDVLPITPRRGLVLAPLEEADAVEDALRGAVATVIDVTGALAALRVAGPHAVTIMRRITDLDLADLPAAGAVARVQAVVRADGAAFELYWPQEYGHYLASVVVDTAAGIR